MRILVAEDEPELRNALVGVLNSFGHETVEVDNGARALELMKQPEAPRLAIMDWMMPGLHGPEVCKQMRATDNNFPPYLILLTARKSKKDISEGLDAGANDYLIKPFDLDELRARIEVGVRFIAMQDRLADNIQKLNDALAQIKTLRGIVPICMSCKMIRDDQGFWNQVEAYVSAHSEATFTHGICPKCVTKFLQEVKHIAPSQPAKK